ncbi:MAG: hypothetical protein ACYCVZ_19390 [Streptosporangiaceae bacterium]
MQKFLTVMVVAGAALMMVSGAGLVVTGQPGFGVCELVVAPALVIQHLAIRKLGRMVIGARLVCPKCRRRSVHPFGIPPPVIRCGGCGTAY